MATNREKPVTQVGGPNAGGLNTRILQGEVVRDIALQTGLVHEVISNEPYVTWQGITLSQSPMLQFAPGRTYVSRGSPGKFTVTSPGIERESDYGDKRVRYSVEFIEGEAKRAGVVEVDQRSASAYEIVPSPIEPYHEGTVHIGPCERFTESSTTNA